MSRRNVHSNVSLFAQALTPLSLITYQPHWLIVLPGQRVVELHRGLVRVEAEAAGGVETTVMGDVALEESYADF